ncbi:cytochrome c551/c552 [Haloferula luteola]|uniref:Cytochrome c551/c552 n=1 Tax=Haloferula luteola TaxID=595692 RepID=A0A840VB37_9BACT|nr:cytochrome c [Haloferula luteola]MBB5352764.1 cytochrome c551/c552 [Haloferula luteola]
MKLSATFLPLLALAATAEDLTPAQVFQMNCSACHAVDHMVVGPSLVEISGIYRGRPDDFVKWCLHPEQKRPGAIEMPSMAHLGEDTLRTLLPYILSEAEGKAEVKTGEGDPFAIPPAMVRRPQVQRIFLPDTSPAAIAVALPGTLSYAFDASECRLRYIWQGGFLDGYPYWKGNGSSLAQLGGPVLYREEAFPLKTASLGGQEASKFLGYEMGDDGLPTFHYRRGSHQFSETIHPLADGSGIERHFEIHPGIACTVEASDGVEVTSSSGSLRIDAAAASSFTLTFRWKK